MKVKHLIAQLQELPPDASIELTRVLAVDKKLGDAYELRLDFPIIGIATSKDDQDALLLVEYDARYLHRFGKLRRFEKASNA